MVRGPTIQPLRKKPTGGLPPSKSKAGSRLPPAQPVPVRPIEEYRMRAALRLDKAHAEVASSLFSLEPDRQFAADAVREALAEIAGSTDPVEIRATTLRTIASLQEVMAAVVARYFEKLAP